ncbi:MAG: ATP-dependent Lon protease, partial [Candidatus Woesearchaeota archaeon]|nr:ATP-dependent Lon protease [Candidatus Woesearchaeota archaeon]
KKANPKSVKLNSKSSKKAKKDFFDFETTAEIPIPKRTIDRVIGQDKAVEIIKKAAKQRRHVLLIGEPGTGKSMLGMALAELLPKENLVDILAYPNPYDENKPIIKTVKAGKGREIVQKMKLQTLTISKKSNWFIILLFILSIIAPWWIRSQYGDIMGAASLIGSWFFLGMLLILINTKTKTTTNHNIPKIIVDNFGRDTAPFYDATGAHAGALLGDVLHDPFQSGGLGTPAHLRVVAGMIHKAHMGVLFIDEIATLKPHTQQELLTALQEGKFPITGQSERSAGSIVRTEPVPCKFILVAAGNIDTVKHMHPALRSRIRGYGYEVYMNDSMKDTPENRKKLLQFIAQEVEKDGKIPHFTKEAALEIIEEARRRANRKGYLTLMLRDLGGIIRSAGDIALEEGAEYVTREHVFKAKKISQTLEQQMSEDYIVRKKQYQIITTTGSIVGKVNGLAVIGQPPVFSGIVLPIEAEVIKNNSQKTRFIATGKLGEIAKEAVTNVSAMVKKLFNEDLNSGYDIHIQFLQTYEGVEGDSASVAIAVAIISALKQIPIKQDVAMTGSLSVRGEVLPVGGVSAKVKAAVDSEIKKVLVPKENIEDIVLKKEDLEKIEIVPLTNIFDVLEHAFEWKGHENILKTIRKKSKK